MLRRAHVLARWVLAWMLLAQAVAVASPLLRPQFIQMACSAGVLKLIVQSEDGAAEVRPGQMDCPLCLNPAAAPPPAWCACVPYAPSLSLASAWQSPSPYRLQPAYAWLARGPPWQP